MGAMVILMILYIARRLRLFRGSFLDTKGGSSEFMTEASETFTYKPGGQSANTASNPYSVDGNRTLGGKFLDTLKSLGQTKLRSNLRFMNPSQQPRCQQVENGPPDDYD